MSQKSFECSISLPALNSTAVHGKPKSVSGVTVAAGFNHLREFWKGSILTNLFEMTLTVLCRGISRYFHYAVS